MRPTIVRTDAELNMGASVMNKLAELAAIVTAEDDRPETLQRLAPQADVIFTCYAPITAEVIQAASKLRGIVKYGVGVDSIDLHAATKRGVPVAHCPHYGTGTVADHAFALMIAVARKTCIVDRNLRHNGWLWPEATYASVDLADKTIGLVGYGRIGRAMAERCAGFGMRILVYDPYVAPPENGCVEFVSFERLIEESDIVSLHPVLTSENRGMIGANQFAAMKPNTIIVNVSRGALIDQDALVAALRDGTIAGAGLDVFSHEPLDRNHPLLELDNVVLSPHFAFYSKEAYRRLENECLDAIVAVLEGRTPRYVKNHLAPSTKSDSLEHLTRDNHVGEALSCDRSAKNEHAVQNHESLVARRNRAESESQEDLRVEGDVNFSANRKAWQDEHLSTATRQQLERDARVFVRQSLSSPCLNEVVACEGVYLIDRDGRRILDFHGNSAHQVGYSHPVVIEAIKNQLDRLSFCPRRYTNDVAVELAERLASLAPGRLNKVLFTPSGTAAVGIALKLARYVTGSHETISMRDSFHGASLDAISIGGESLFRDGLGPLLPGCHHVDWPKQAAEATAIEEIMTRRRIGAVICEPMRCTTIDIPPTEYWCRVRQLCEEHGALLVFDEIPLALGRTGAMFCCEHFGVEPDVLVIGKGLGGGVMPLAGVVVRDDLDIVPERAIGHYTHEKSPVAAAAALATLDIIQKEGLLERAQALGRWALQRLLAMQGRHPRIIHDVRGLGLALGIELRRNGDKAVDEADRVMYTCLSRGLSFKVSDGNVLTFTPPLIISQSQMARALDILEEAIDHVEPSRSC